MTENQVTWGLLETSQFGGIGVWVQLAGLGDNPMEISDVSPGVIARLPREEVRVKEVDYMAEREL